MARSRTERKLAQRTGTAQRAERRVEIGTGWAVLAYFAIAVIYFLPAFFPGRHIFGSDYTQSGYIFYEFARQQIASGSLPKWVPYIYGGLPLFANPGSVYYPVRLLANLLMPGTWAQPFVYVFQFGIAGVGMYLLARELRCRTWVAFIAGLAFQLTGITLSAVQAGHDGRIIVATFAPLFLFFLHRAVRTGTMAAYAGAAATIGFALLSFQIQSNYYLLLAGAAWALFALVHLGIVRTPRRLAVRSALGIAAVVFGFLMAAVNFLPFQSYVADSPRGTARGYDYSTTWSLPPAELLGVAVPEHSGTLDDYRGRNPFKLNTEYTGAVVLLLFVLGFAICRRNRHWLFFFGMIAVTLTVTLGGYTPLYRLYYEFLPGTQQFRSPSISFFLIALSLVAMAALTLERLAQLNEARVERRAAREPAEGARAVGWVIAGFIVVVAVGAIVAALTKSPANATSAAGFGRFAIASGAAALVLWLWWAGALRTAGFVALLAIVTVTDLVTVNRRFFSTVDGPERMFAPDPLITYLMGVPKPSRVWILPAVDWQDNNALMLFDVEQAGGEHGNQLQRWNEYAGAGEQSYVDWHNFSRNSKFVNAASIRYVVSRVDLNLGADTATLAERHRVSGFVYENRKALPRAYLVGNVITTADTMAALEIFDREDFDPAETAVVYSEDAITLPDTPLQGSAEIVEHTPDRVVVRTFASRPALLVLADNYHRDWTVRVNNVEAPILRTNHTFRGVQVEAGRSELVFEFTPRSLRIGFVIYLFALGMLTAYTVWLVVRRFRRPRTPAA